MVVEFFDMEVHEHPVIEGTVGEINALVVHRDYRGIEHWIAKHNAYSSWEANRYRALQAGGESAWGMLNPRQQKKYKSLPKWWLAPAYFCLSYFAKRGFLDGRVGFHFAMLKAWYFYTIRLKIKHGGGVVESLSGSPLLSRSFRGRGIELGAWGMGHGGGTAD